MDCRDERLREGRPTIRSVAQRANVAISTVSRVVNGGRVSEALRRRVQRAIDELGYTPSVAAQSLVSGRAGCIGLAVNSTQSPWFTQILGGIEESLASSRQSVVLASMMLSGRYDPSAVLTWINDRRVDGLIVVRYSLRDEPLLSAASAVGIPVVLIAPDLDAPATFTVRCNNRQAGWLAAQHLLELGHRRIGYCGGPSVSLDSRLRLLGVEEALAERGLEVERAHVSFGSDYCRDAGIACAESLLRAPLSTWPTAMVLGNDPMALAFSRTLMAAGVAIPERISVVGFDGTPDGEQCWPGLTTVRQPTRVMAAKACEALLQGILSPSAATNPGPSVEFPVDLVVRDSTCPPLNGKERTVPGELRHVQAPVIGNDTKLPIHWIATSSSDVASGRLPTG